MTAWEPASDRVGDDDTLDDATVEELLAGRYHGDAPDLVGVSRFVQRMRAFADRPVPPPSVALSRLLSDPGPVPGSDGLTARPPRHADPLIGPRMPLRGSTPRRVARRLPVPATAAAVCVVLVALVLGAGSARLLPGPAQSLVAQAVRAVTPFGFPEQKKAQAWFSTAPTPPPTNPQGAGPGASPAPRMGEPPKDGGSSIGSGATDRTTGPSGTALAPRPSTTTTPTAATTATTSSPGPAPTVPGSSVEGPAVTTSTAPPRPASKLRLSADLRGMTGAQGAGDPDGQGTAVLDTNLGRDELCLTLVTSGLDPVTAVHLHAGSVEFGGPVVATFKPNADPSPRCVSVADELIRQIRKDPTRYYVEVHSSEFPEGALRGQLMNHRR